MARKQRRYPPEYLFDVGPAFVVEQHGGHRAKWVNAASSSSPDHVQDQARWRVDHPAE